MSYTFSPHVAAHEISIFAPLLLCMVSQASSLFTQGQKKSLRKVKGSLGPLSRPSTVFSCHFLSSIIVLPRISSISLEIWLFFLGNAPFKESILRSLCSLQSTFARTFLLIPIFTIEAVQGIFAFLLIVGNGAVILHYIYFYIESHKIFILHSLTMSHHTLLILQRGNSGRPISPLDNPQRRPRIGFFYFSFCHEGIILVYFGIVVLYC